MFDFTLAFYISQFLAFIALISDIIGFQMKKREHILALSGFTVFCLSIHQYLLGNIAASLILGLAVIRYIISIYYTKKIILIIFLILSFIAFILTYEKLIDFLVLFGTIFLTIAAFQKEEIKLRIINMFGFSFYILFNILSFSPFGVLARLSVFFSNLIGLYRFHYKK